MTYVKQGWTDGVGGNTPLSAARLAHMESGIESAHQRPAIATETPFATSKIHAFGLVMGVVGMNGAGRIWSRDATNGNLSQSDDWGANWTNLRGLPANTSQSGLGKVVAFGGNIYTVLLDSLVANTYRVYRAPDVVRTAPLVWEAPVFTMPTLTHANTRSCFNAGSQYLFLGTYTGLGTDDSRIYRSSDGLTWNVCYGPTAGVHHIHAVAEDPYNPGHVYAALGDNASPAGVIRSTDHGTTWSTIIPSVPGENPWQSVQISFSPNWVWMAGDRIGLVCVIFDRDTLIPYQPCSNWHYNIAVVGGTAVTDRYYQIGYWGAVDPGTESYYLVANDTSAAGNTQGIFVLPHIGGRIELLESKPSGGVGEVFVGNGYMWAGERKWRPHSIAMVTP